MAAHHHVRNTTCPYCGVGCGVDAQVDGGDLIAVSGSQHHPANLGRLCVKGAALHETTGGDGRLLYPEIGGRRVDWESAIAAVGDGFREVIRQHGPDAVAFYLSGQLLTEDYYVANKLMKGFIGSANVDTNSRLCMASAVAGYKRAFGADAVPGNYRDLEECDLLVMTGSNAAWTHPVLYQRIAAAKARRPQMRVVVIDPRRTATCDIADLHLAPASGSDGHLFAGLLRHLHHRGAVDHDYTAAHTNGFDSALEAASPWDPARVAAVTRIDQDKLTQFYRWFTDTEKTVSFYSQGINQSATGTDKCNAIINCHLATGRIGRTGMGPFSITGQPNAMGGREVGGLANQLAAHMDFTPGNVDRVGRFWGTDTMARAPGLKAVELFGAIERGQVKAVWIMATNPVVSMPDADRVRRALKQCPLVVVSDCIADTDTIACADILLPATGWSEKDGTVTNSERCISRQRALRPAAGEARHDWRIVADVAARMGFGHAFAYHSPADIFREHARLSGFENQGERAFDLSALAELSDRDYENFEPVQWPVNGQYPSGRARLFDDNRFYTGDGRARFVPVRPALPEAGANSAYPYILNTGRIRDQWHTMTRTGLAPRLLSHIDSPALAIHPRDARRHGLVDGDLAVVSSEHGSMRLPVTVVETVSPGELFAPMHWNDRFAADARVGALVPPVTDRHSGQPQSKYTPVAVAKVTVASWLQLVSRTEPDTGLFDYWVKIPIQGGYRYLLALAPNNKLDIGTWFRSLAPALAPVEFMDPAAGDYRCILHHNGRLEAAVFASAESASLPESPWLGDCFNRDSGQDAWQLLAGRDGAGENQGRLICSCLEVGEAQILRAAAAGADTPKALGETLGCGTNCGSCIPELKALIQSLAKDAA